MIGVTKVPVNHPLYPCQHAYPKGKSTDAALHILVSRIERSKQQFFSVCLDIKGTFDNTRQLTQLFARLN